MARRVHARVHAEQRVRASHALRGPTAPLAQHPAPPLHHLCTTCTTSAELPFSRLPQIYHSPLRSPGGQIPGWLGDIPAQGGAQCAQSSSPSARRPYRPRCRWAWLALRGTPCGRRGTVPLLLRGAVACGIHRGEGGQSLLILEGKVGIPLYHCLLLASLAALAVLRPLPCPSAGFFLAAARPRTSGGRFLVCARPSANAHSLCCTVPAAAGGDMELRHRTVRPWARV